MEKNDSTLKLEVKVAADAYISKNQVFKVQVVGSIIYSKMAQK